MTVMRGFAIVLASGFVGGSLGTGIGYLLGRFTPDYYRTVFRTHPNVNFDPLQTGIGLGLTQGLLAGLIVGLCVLLAVTWYNSRIGDRK